MRTNATQPPALLVLRYPDSVRLLYTPAVYSKNCGTQGPGMGRLRQGCQGACPGTRKVCLPRPTPAVGPPTHHAARRLEGGGGDVALVKDGAPDGEEHPAGARVLAAVAAQARGVCGRGHAGQRHGQAPGVSAAGVAAHGQRRHQAAPRMPHQDQRPPGQALRRGAGRMRVFGRAEPTTRARMCECQCTHGPVAAVLLLPARLQACARTLRAGGVSLLAPLLRRKL